MGASESLDKKSPSKAPEGASDSAAHAFPGAISKSGVIIGSQSPIVTVGIEFDAAGKSATTVNGQLPAAKQYLNLPGAQQLPPPLPLQPATKGGVDEVLHDPSSNLDKKFSAIKKAAEGGRVDELMGVLSNSQVLEPEVVGALAKQILAANKAGHLSAVIRLANDEIRFPSIREPLYEQLAQATITGVIQPSLELKNHFSNIFHSFNNSESTRRGGLEAISSKMPELLAGAVSWCRDFDRATLLQMPELLKSLPKSSDIEIQKIVAHSLKNGAMDSIGRKIRGEFDIACGEPNFLATTIGKWRSAGIEPEFCDLLERAQRGKIDYPARFSAGSLKQLLDVRENDSTISADQTKPVVLFVLPKDGAGGAMSALSQAVTDLQKGARVVVMEATGDKDLISQTQEFSRREGRQFAALVLNGHGNGSVIVLGTTDPMKSPGKALETAKMIDTSDESALSAPAFTGCFAKQVNVLLLSCYANRRPDGDSGATVHSMFKRIFPQGETVGAGEEIKFKELVIDKRGVPTGFKVF